MLPNVVGWTPGNWVIWLATLAAAAAALWRTSRRPRDAVAEFLREAKAAIYDIRGWPAVVDPRTREVKSQPVPGLGARMTQLEDALRLTGQLRDLSDGVRATQVSSDQAKRRANDAAVLAGEAATLAARNDQQLTEFRQESSRRHADNVERLDTLEAEVHDARDREHKLLGVLHDVLHLDIRVEAANEPEGGPS